jgi:hypothetical protein
MRIRLLNDGGYAPAFGNVELPATVNAELYLGLYWVHKKELARIGADMDLLEDDSEDDESWPFDFDEGEVEVLPE